MRILTTICRILVGTLFIISGLIKANDPLGFAYKLEEYFQVFGMEWLKGAALFLAIFICVFEVVCGIVTLTGTRMKLFAWLLLLMIVFFTFLTFYSAYYNKVTDCGCFGDALKGIFGRSLTPWESFTKDIILFILIIPIFISRNRIHSLFAPTGDIVTIALSAILCTWFSVNCYRHLPWVDFRPYAKGKSIPEGMVLPPNARRDSVQMIFIYNKDGKQVELSEKDVMKIDSTYEFVDRKDKIIRQGDKAPIHDFSITNPDGVDITQQVLTNPEYNFLVVCYDINKTDKSVQADLNEFVAGCRADSLDVYGLSASTPEDVDKFRHEVQAMYDFCSADETTLKTMIRSNPGLILLKSGVVIDMWHGNDIPKYEKFREKYLKK
jgi:uncharacterized membrane protein YphA (DoxX/SURF4 family)